MDLSECQTHDELRDALSAIGNVLAERGDPRASWAGIPMPLEGEALIMEPTYPMASFFESLCGGGKPSEPPTDFRVRSTFWSSAKRCEVVIVDKPDGRIDWGLVLGVHSMDQQLKTLGCSDAWGLEQEQKAMTLLESLVTPRQYRQYVLTGMFLESSKRSGVTYVFRRLRPTVALHIVDGDVRVLCTLCMHPIGYYEGSWAGAMTPSDDVIGHLILMRGDEPMFWRRANQHPAYRPQSGL